MKKLIFCAALLFCLYCLVPFQANAQQTFGYSQVGYDDITNTVYGSSTTIVDYIGAFHYRAYVEGYLYDQSGNLLDSGYDEGYFIAEVLTIAPAFPLTQYTLYSDHYLVAHFYTTVNIRECDPYCYYCFDYFLDPYCNYCYSCSENYWWDPFGFSFGYPGYYGPWWYFYGYGPPANLETEYIYLGSTSDSLITPAPCPNVTIQIRATFGGSDAVINGMTKPALVGANVQLEALAILSDGEIVQGGGNFHWSAPNDARSDPDPMIPSYFFRAYWPSEGTKTVRVTFTPPGTICHASAYVNIAVTIPDFVSFSAEQHGTQINAGAHCSNIEGVTYTLGCLNTNPGGRKEHGIDFSATFMPPAGYISAPIDSKLKFVQIINPDSRHRRRGESSFECQTSPSVFSPWMLDTNDPYSAFSPSLKSFAEHDAGGLLTITADDSPGFELDGPEMSLDYLSGGDEFEMYVVYFVGDTYNPLIQRVLAKLPWNWKGDVVYNSVYNPPYLEGFSLSSPGPKQGIPSVYVQTPHQGNVTSLVYGACPGEPTPTPTPEVDPCYVGRKYICQ